MRRHDSTAETLPDEEVPADFAPVITRLRKDLRAAAANLTAEEARYLVDLYYQLQHFRIASANQVRSGEREPNAFLTFTADAMHALERNVARAMDVYTDGQVVSRWAKSQYGIGPILAAGLIAHIDITRAKTAGAIWRFAGLDPSAVWEKGKKRPYNAALKVLCWKIGTSFWKFHNRPDCFYGKLMEERKAKEVARNERGDCAEAAAATLLAKNIRDKATRDKYEAGRLPDGRVHLRAQRWVVKLFLAHWWQVAREAAGLEVPKPYVITYMDHVHEIVPPGWPMPK